MILRKSDLILFGHSWVGGEDDLVCPMGGSWEGSPVKKGTFV